LGGQYNHLIYRRLIEIGVKARLINYSLVNREMLRDVDAIVLGGGPQSLCNEEYRNSSSGLAEIIVKTDRPVLGICLSHHLIAYAFKGVVGKADKPEYGEVEISVIDEDVLFDGLPKNSLYGSPQR